MSKFFFILILIIQINYLFLSPSKNFKKKNLKQKSKKKKERKLDDRSDDIVIIHLNDVHCGLNYSIGYDGLFSIEKNYKKNISMY